MSVVTFRGYGVLPSDITIVVDYITHWERIEYNGRSGTRIYLATGKDICVDPSPWEVEKILHAARTEQGKGK